MTDYTELVKALRCKRDDCEGCDLAFFDKDEGWMCQYAAKDDDAADAIEALRKRLVSALTALHLANEKMGYYGIQPYTEADGEDMISDWVKTLVHEELEQQLPKQRNLVEVVRCKDCYWNQTQRFGNGKEYCECSRGNSRINDGDWYCPEGEKMEVQDGE